MGVNYTINHPGEKYLVIHVRKLVKRVIKDCCECARRFKTASAQQQMAPLLPIRLEVTSKPFANCAVDFGGPYLTIQGRGRARARRYLCLFLCLQTRGGEENSSNFRIRIIQQKLTSHPVKLAPSSLSRQVE